MKRQNVASTAHRLVQNVRDESAQGVVEFALLLSVLSFLFLGAIDYGRFMYYQTGLVSAARIGAETASNHCPYNSSNCGTTQTVTGDTFVLWATSCEAAPFASLIPQYTSCTSTRSTSWAPACSGTCTNCSNDICVSPTPRSTGTQVTVTVGYSFKPISFLMAPFFHEQSCFSGDSPSVNHHTLCASSVGKVS